MKDSVPAKSKGSKAEGSSEGKKRFEVKKVRCQYREEIIKLKTLYSGTLSLCGRGILSSTTVPSAATISWIYVRPPPVSDQPD